MKATWVLVISLAILTGFNIYYMLFFRSKLKKGISVTDNENYLKLDAKVDLLKYIAITIISVGSFFGVTKFSELSQSMQEMQDIDKKYVELEQSYKSLHADYEELVKRNNQINEMYSSFQLQLKDIDYEFLNMQYKIKEAANKIPEGNIRLLTKQLIESNLRDIGNEGFFIDGPDSTYIAKELEQANEMLKMAGYSISEIEGIIGYAVENYPGYDAHGFREK